MTLIGNIRVKLSDLIFSFSRALDFVNPAMTNHHMRVAIIASEIAKEFGVSRQEIVDIFLASTLHDIGAFSLKDRLTTLEFEVKNPQLHAERGYVLLKDKGLNIFSDIARIIRYHHTPWEGGRGSYFLSNAGDEKIPAGSHIIHLADRIEVLIDKQRDALSQSKRIVEVIKARSNKAFMPELVSAFESLSAKEYFWFDAASPEIDQIVSDRSLLPEVDLDIDSLLKISGLFSHIIDYRSPFTAVHSAGVSAVATLLAQMIGFSDIECKLMSVAGYLHDIGKLAVPAEILEKPAKLSVEEFNVMKSHVYHSYRILKTVAGFDIINLWASFHHERIDGNGYPFHLSGGELSIGSRVMAVADVLTALTEDRPYRKGISGEDALKIIEDMAKNNNLDQSIVGIAGIYFRHLNDIRINAQSKAAAEYMAVKQFMG